MLQCLTEKTLFCYTDKNMKEGTVYALFPCCRTSFRVLTVLSVMVFAAPGLWAFPPDERELMDDLFGCEIWLMLLLALLVLRCVLCDAEEDRQTLLHLTDVSFSHQRRQGPCKGRFLPKKPGSRRA